MDSSYANTGNVSIGFANTSASHIASNSRGCQLSKFEQSVMHLEVVLMAIDIE
jgi:hypothetical protein